MAAEEGHLEQGLGVFAFKEMSRVMKDFSGMPLIYGTVYLWGDIVEHKIGYRAQYAGIRSLDFQSPGTGHTLQYMRELYRVENPDEGIIAESLRRQLGEDDRARG